MDINQDGKDDIQQLKDFLSDVGTDLLENAAAAWEWLKNELAKIKQLFADGLEIIKAAINQAIGQFGSRPLGELVADTLTILANTAKHIFDVTKSDVLTALIGLTAPKAIAPAPAA